MTAPPASGATGVKARLEQRLAERDGAVFLRVDFTDLGDYAQVGRALRALVEDGRLLKMGYGMYARAQLSRLDRKPMPTRSIRELAAEALGRLGVETVPTTAEEDYNSGRSVQVPTGRVIGVRQRVRRKIIYGGVPL